MLGDSRVLQRGQLGERRRQITLGQLVSLYLWNLAQFGKSISKSGNDLLPVSYS
jgi:hypothetical protein